MNIEREPDEFQTHISGVLVLQKLLKAPPVHNIYQEQKKNYMESL